MKHFLFACSFVACLSVAGCGGSDGAPSADAVKSFVTENPDIAKRAEDAAAAEQKSIEEEYDTPIGGGI
ncbi:hypothetical protein Poly51_54480 [Rubripirellula tenax]|uniref:Secreted protein n=1 Tax=Rubripirellula tenax TaxID=2528015 RepID=A0A5C6EJ22_9BACT|nr:hypothetical protein [Rubripirellula tenax]TWU47646.1 hypothetical protein Poly51_54480 [Rubripirellula tenax]